jgi:hypothetical protein
MPRCAEESRRRGILVPPAAESRVFGILGWSPSRGYCFRLIFDPDPTEFRAELVHTTGDSAQPTTRRRSADMRFGSVSEIPSYRSIVVASLPLIFLKGRQPLAADHGPLV